MLPCASLLQFLLRRTEIRGFGLPLLDSTVDLDVDDIANPVCQLATQVSLLRAAAKRADVLVLLQVSREPDHTLLPEIPREGVSRTSTETCGVTHLACLLGVSAWIDMSKSGGCCGLRKLGIFCVEANPSRDSGLGD